MSALADSGPDRRYRIHAELERRNRIVAVLRVLVPAFGVVLLTVLMVGIVIGSMGLKLGFADIRIDRDNLVVEAPKLSATMPDGTAYALDAGSARVSTASADLISLKDVTFSADLPGNAGVISAQSAEALLEAAQKRVEVPGSASFTTSDGIAGTVVGMTADLSTSRASSTGPVAATLGETGTLAAATMQVDMQARVWTFSDVTVTLNSTPGAAP